MQDYVRFTHGIVAVGCALMWVVVAVCCTMRVQASWFGAVLLFAGCWTVALLVISFATRGAARALGVLAAAGGLAVFVHSGVTRTPLAPWSAGTIALTAGAAAVAHWMTSKRATVHP